MRHFITGMALAFLFVAPAYAAGDSGSSADVSAIRKLEAKTAGACPQRVSHVAVLGGYALATVEQRGSCDMAAVWVFYKSRSWRALGALGGVPDACLIHAKGVPSAIAPALIRAFTGSSDPSLASMKSCGG